MARLVVEPKHFAAGRQVAFHPAKWNFNVSLPLWDFLRGTIAGQKQPEAAAVPQTSK
jgi:hypothetical protein